MEITQIEALLTHNLHKALAQEKTLTANFNAILLIFSMKSVKQKEGRVCKVWDYILGSLVEEKWKKKKVKNLFPLIAQKVGKNVHKIYKYPKKIRCNTNKDIFIFE